MRILSLLFLPILVVLIGCANPPTMPAPEKIVATEKVPAEKVSVRESSVKHQTLLLKTYGQGYYQVDLRKVKVVIDETLGGTYAEFKTWKNPPIDQDNYTKAWLCSEIVVYVRSADIKHAWEFVLNDAIREQWGPQDAIPHQK